MDFTDDEIREELARLGYNSVPTDKLAEFKRDLFTLINAEKSKNSSLDSSVEDRQADIQIAKGDYEFAAGNVSNHGSQWIDQDFRDDYQFLARDEKVSTKFNEDWDYRGTDQSNSRIIEDILDSKSRPKTAPNNKTSSKVPGTYSLYEMPDSSEVRGHTQASSRTNVSNNWNLAEEFKEEEMAHMDSSTASGRCVKRKTCRRLASGIKRIDESFTESDTGDVFKVYERMSHQCQQRKPPIPKARNSFEIPVGSAVPSFIRKPVAPHLRRAKQPSSHDLMQKYKNMWTSHPAPGETSRDGVINAIHEKLMKKFEVKKCQRIYIPNNFKRPHEEPRTALRWSVRSAIESYEMPEHGIYHEVDSVTT